MQCSPYGGAVSDPAIDLLDRCRRGDTQAYARLLQEHQNGVYSLARGILHDHHEAQDMTQEVFVRAWRALPGFRGESSFSTWLYRIAVNTCLNRRRQLRPQLQVVDSEPVLARIEERFGDPVQTTIQNERNEHLWATVDRLPEKYRLVIILFYQQQLSYREIAETLSLPLGTVKAHLNRARRLLASNLQDAREAIT